MQVLCVTPSKHVGTPGRGRHPISCTCSHLPLFSLAQGLLDTASNGKAADLVAPNRQPAIPARIDMAACPTNHHYAPPLPVPASVFAVQHERASCCHGRLDLVLPVPRPGNVHMLEIGDCGRIARGVCRSCTHQVSHIKPVLCVDDDDCIIVRLRNES
jgi:hypothetical protein